MAVDRHHNALPAGYRLHWYRIESVLGQGGFGITYLATDTNLDQPVAIKEFLPSGLAVRTHDSGVHPASDGRADTFGWGLNRFLSEARTLAQFRHPNIVRVYSVFEANGTAYMVMEYEHGTSLEDAFKFRRIAGERALAALVHALMDGLELVHQAGFIHRDIKPDNVFLRAEDGVPVLLDFGSARQALGVETRTLTSLVTPGYAPFEQYNASRENDRQGPWTDVYSLAATLYRGITGRGPIDAMARADALLSGQPDPLIPLAALEPAGVSPQMMAAVDLGLAFQPAERPQSLAEWRALLPPRPTTPDFSAAADTANAMAAAGSEDETVVRGASGAVAGSDDETVVGAARGAATGRDDETVVGAAPGAMAGGDDGTAAGAGTRPVAQAAARGAATAAPGGQPATARAAAGGPAPRGGTRRAAWALAVLLLAAAAGAAWYRLGGPGSAPPPDPSRSADLTAGTGSGAARRAGGPEAASPAGAAQGGSSGQGLAAERARLEEERRALAAERARLSLEAEQRAAEAARRSAEAEAARMAEARERLDAERRRLEQEREQERARQAAAPEPPAAEQPAAASGEPASASGEGAVAAGDAQTAGGSVAERVDALLAMADEDVAALRLTSPEGGNAFERYRAVLDLVPGEPRARAGLDRIVARYVALAAQAADAGDDDRAESLLARAQQVKPGDPSVAGALSELEARRREAAQRAAARELAEAERARVEARRAREAAERRAAREAEQRRSAREAALARDAAERERRDAEARARAESEARARDEAQQRRHVRLGVFPNESRVICFHPVGSRIEEAARAVAARFAAVDLAFSYYGGAAHTDLFGDGSAVWEGSAVRKTPRVEAVRRAARALDVDAAIMGFYHCASSQYVDEDTYEVEVFVVDVPSGEVHRAQQPLLDTRKAVAEALRALRAARR